MTKQFFLNPIKAAADRLTRSNRRRKAEIAELRKEVAQLQYEVQRLRRTVEANAEFYEIRLDNMLQNLGRLQSHVHPARVDSER